MRNVARTLTIFYIISLISINIPLTGVAGSVVRIFGLISLGAWVASLMETKRMRRFTTTHVMFLLFAGLYAFSLLWTVNSGATEDAAYRQALMVGAMVLIYDLFAENERTAAVCTQAGVIGCTIVSLWTIYNSMIGKVYFDRARFAADGLHPNSSAFIAIVGIPLAWGLLTQRTTPWKILIPFNAGYIFIAIYALILTGSRGGVLEAIPVLLWAMYMLGKTKFGPVLVAAVLFAGSIFAGTNETVKTNLARVTDFGQLQKDRGSGREDLWKEAIGQFEDNPLIGAGAGAFRVEIGTKYAAEGAGVGAHHAWLETAADLGMVGVILLALTIFSLPIAMLKARPGLKSTLLVAWSPLAIIMFFEQVQGFQFFWAIFFILMVQTNVASRAQRVPVRQPEPTGVPASSFART
ncbi:O-antigen ligase domain-containing protein [bacterium]|nr:MAG: O-antigen ligase domain-containing protein [bacterium]